MIRKSAEIIQEHETSRAFKDSIVIVGAESIIALAEEGIRGLDQQEGESPEE